MKIFKHPNVGEIHEIFQDLDPFQDNSVKEQALVRYLLTHLMTLHRDIDKLAFFKETEAIFNKFIQDENHSQSEQNIKRLLFKELLLKNLFFSAIILAAKDHALTLQILKWTKEKQVEFYEILNTIRKNMKVWELTLDEHQKFNGLHHRITREFYLNLLIRNLTTKRIIKNLDVIIYDLKKSQIEFMKQSGFTIKQMGEFQKISQKSIDKLEKEFVQLEDSFSQIENLKNKSFSSKAEINNSVDLHIQKIRKSFIKIFIEKKRMHESCKKYIEKNKPTNPQNKDNVELYKEMVEKPSDHKIKTSLQAILEKYSKPTAASSSSDSIDSSKRSLTSAEEFKSMVESRYGKEHSQNLSARDDLITTRIKQESPYSLSAPIHSRSHRENDMTRMFELEMKNLDEKLKELANQKKSELTTRMRRAAVYERPKKISNPPHASRLSENLQDIQTSFERLDKQQKDFSEKEQPLRSIRAKKMADIQNLPQYKMKLSPQDQKETHETIATPEKINLRSKRAMMTEKLRKKPIESSESSFEGSPSSADQNTSSKGKKKK